MTHFSERPQGNNQAWVLMGTVDQTHRLENEKNYLLVNLALGYRQNFRSCELGRYFFTEDAPLIAGPINTEVNVQNLALGLSQTFRGSGVLNPQVTEGIADLDFFAGLDHWHQGLWLRARLPFIRNGWGAFFQTEAGQVGSALYPDGLFAPYGTPVPVVYRDLIGVLNGNCGFGAVPALCAGKICPFKMHRWGLSDVHLELGYDFYRGERANAGIALIGAIPTGVPNDKPCENMSLFVPTIGSQRSGQIGCLLRGQYEIFNKKEEEKVITLYGDLRLLHLTEGKVRRLCTLNVGNTRAFNYWSLLNVYDGNGMYQGIQRAANILNRFAKVSADMLEFSAVIQMRKGHADLTAGYNLWVRGQENLCLCDKQLSIPGSCYYTLKYMGPETPVTRYIGQGAFIENPDTCNVVYSNNGPIEATPENVKKYALYDSRLSTCCAQHPQTYSNTFFGYAGYEFNDHRHTPHLGVGVTAEFGCGNTALNMWGCFVKGSLDF